MTHMEKRKKEVQLQQVKGARMAQELRVEELLEEIERVKLAIEVQLKTEATLQDEINKG